MLGELLTYAFFTIQDKEELLKVGISTTETELVIKKNKKDKLREIKKSNKFNNIRK